MPIKPPIDIDSIGKLNEWLAGCGMPQGWPDDTKQCPVPPPSNRPFIKVEHRHWRFAFTFDPDDREAANAGYRDIIAKFALLCYEQFSGHIEANEVFWRVPPLIRELPEVIITLQDGSPITDLDAVEDDEIETVSFTTGMMVGSIDGRLLYRV